MRNIAYTMAVQGGVHRWQNKPCEDHVTQLSYRGVTALSLCDGAGSLPLSGPGAQTLSQAFAEYLARHFDRLALLPSSSISEEAVFLIQRVLAELCSQYNAPPEAFGSTLLAAASDVRGRFLILHLGDGIIAGLNSSDCIFPVSAPEGVDNATYLSCSDEDTLRRHVRVYKYRNIKGVLLLSDGSKGIFYTDPSGRGSTLRLSPQLRGLICLLQCNRFSFAADFPDFVRRQLKPVDDFSIGILAPHISGAARITHGLRTRLKASAAARRIHVRDMEIL